jgi:hypothetical protein
MVWVIIIVVLVVAFGPILWLVPSRRDRRLAAMRQRAAQCGLVVELARLPKAHAEPSERVTSGGRIKEPVIECAAYRLVLQESLRELPPWRAQRGRDPDFQVPGWEGTWAFELERRPAAVARPEAAAAAAALAPLVARLPTDVVGLEFGQRQLTAYWLERPSSNADSVSVLAQLLREMEAALTRLNADLEAARRAQEEDED